MVGHISLNLSITNSILMYNRFFEWNFRHKKLLLCNFLSIWKHVSIIPVILSIRIRYILFLIRHQSCESVTSSEKREIQALITRASIHVHKNTSCTILHELFTIINREHLDKKRNSEIIEYYIKNSTVIAVRNYTKIFLHFKKFIKQWNEKY